MPIIPSLEKNGASLSRPFRWIRVGSADATEARGPAERAAALLSPLKGSSNTAAPNTLAAIGSANRDDGPDRGRLTAMTPGAGPRALCNFLMRTPLRSKLAFTDSMPAARPKPLGRRIASISIKQPTTTETLRSLAQAPRSERTSVARRDLGISTVQPPFPLQPRPSL